MSNALAPLQGQAVAGAFAPLMQTHGSELSDGVGGNFAVVSIKGKVFQIKHQKNTIPLLVVHEGVQFPAPYFDVVIARANGALSKTYYKDGYADGSDSSPDCWSEDGIVPLAPLAQRPIEPTTGQHCTQCATCPMNAFGSKVNNATGSAGKACADTRKLAIVPSQDLINDRFNGPMLFRTPAASLKGLAEYDRMLQAQNIPYYAVVTRLTFDATQSYPKLVFTPVRMLTDAEAPAIIGLRSDPRVDVLLTSAQASAPQLPPPANLGPVPGAFAPQAPAPAPDAHLYPQAPVPQAVDPMAAHAAALAAHTAAQAAHAAAAPVYAAPVAAPVYAAPAPAPVPVQAAPVYPSHITPMPPATQAPPPPSTQGLVFAAPPVAAGPVAGAPVPMPTPAPAPAGSGITASPAFFDELNSLIGS